MTAEKKEEGDGTATIPEMGASIGAFLTDGSSLGAGVGYVVGKKVEEVLVGQTFVTFKPERPEPPKRDAAKEIAVVVKKRRGNIGKKLGSVLSKIMKKSK